MTDQNKPSYVDDYAPPALPQDDTANTASMPQDSTMQPNNDDMTTNDDMTANDDTTAAPAPVSSHTPMTSVSQALEDQNIFFLLGVTDGTDEEREAFLDELQQVIWEDFLENDVELLITEEETVELKRITANKGLSDEQQQEQVIVYLEKLIPDLEEIMLEKALELKEDMVRERIAGMREYYAEQSDQLQKLDEAERLVNDDQWRAAADTLNAMK
jgi:hypothetical protein